MSLIPLFQAHHQLFVSVEVNVDVERNLLVRNSNPRCGEPSLVLTGGLRLQAEVLEVVDTLGVHQVYRLEVVHGSPSVVVTESALQSDVVVFHAAADEIVLEKKVVRNPNHPLFILSINISFQVVRVDQSSRVGRYICIL